MNKILCGILISILSLACAGPKQIALLKQGDTQTNSFYQEIPFRYIKDHIFIDVVIEGRTYNFLFDTGFAISTIDDDLLAHVDFQSSLKSKVSGSSFEKHTIEFGTLSGIKIADIDFREIGVGMEDLYYINEDYICENHVDGVIGANLLRKAKWQIDYQNQLIRFTDDFSKLKVDPAAIVLDMSAHQGGYGYGKVQLRLDGIERDFIFDTGSSGGFTTGLDNWDEFQKLEPDFATKLYGNELTGKALVPNHLVQINKLEMGPLIIENALLSLEKGASSLLGNGFLQQYQLSMDWDRNQLYLVPVSAYEVLPLRGFGLTLRADYESNKVIIGAKRSGTEYENIKLGTQVLSINGVDVSAFDQAQLCRFWQTQWARFSTGEQITLILKNIESSISLKKQVILSR